MKKITSKFHLGALTIVIQLWGDFFRRSITTWKSWPNVLKFQSIFILATDLPTLTILVWVSRFFLMAFRQASQSHGFWGNTLAMKLLIRNRTTPCCTFRPSYPLIPVIKEKKSGILLQEWPCLNKEYFHPRRNGKKFRLIWNGKILNLTTFCRISRIFFLGLQIFRYQGLASLLPSVATDGIGNNFNKIVYLNIVLNNITGPLC